MLKSTTLKTMEPVSQKQVVIEDSFWSPRQQQIEQVVIPYQWKVLNDAIPGIEPSHAVKNFRIAADLEEGSYYGKVFQDSDLAKWLEAVGFCLSLSRDEQLEAIADEVIDLLEKAQQQDGYLNTYYTLAKPGKRWTNLRDDHELYCAGHFIEAAVSYYQATGKSNLLNIVCRYVDYIGSVFGREPGQKRGYDGHEEIELALVKLYRATGNAKYLELSKYFIDERGQQPHYFDTEAETREENKQRRFSHDYSQSHIPVRKQTIAEGHAVRAMYLYSAMADLAAEFNDESLLESCRKLWDSVTKRRMYITGGIGSTAYGEAFTLDYDLPNDRAYTETCASIGLVLWAHRMLQMEADRKYADIMERALYNGILSGISLDGKSYFYVNPLEIWPADCDNRNKHDLPRTRYTRQPWFPVACCPPNIARLIASLGNYLYSQNNDEVFFHLYVGSKATFHIANLKVEITTQTNYPWDELVNLTVSPEKAAEFTLALRIPDWCRNATIHVNGEPIDVDSCTVKGYAKIKRTWQQGDQIVLSLPMPVERIRANPNVRSIAGKLALQRGPVVFCLEEADNGQNLPDISLPAHSQLSVDLDDPLFDGIPTIYGEALRRDSSSWEDSLYSPSQHQKVSCQIKAVPYYLWGNRRPGEMLVWIQEQ